MRHAWLGKTSKQRGFPQFRKTNLKERKAIKREKNSGANLHNYHKISGIVN